MAVSLEQAQPHLPWGLACCTDGLPMGLKELWHLVSFLFRRRKRPRPREVAELGGMTSPLAELGHHPLQRPLSSGPQRVFWESPQLSNPAPAASAPKGHRGASSRCLHESSSPAESPCELARRAKPEMGLQDHEKARDREKRSRGREVLGGGGQGQSARGNGI